MAKAIAIAKASLNKAVNTVDNTDDNDSEGFVPSTSLKNLKKREARQKREAFWRATFPELYAAGLSHAEVGQRVAALRVAQPPPPPPHHGAQLLADG